MEAKKPQETQSGAQALRNIALFFIGTIVVIVAVKLLVG